jgi:hypothetical protein
MVSRVLQARFYHLGLKVLLVFCIETWKGARIAEFMPLGVGENLHAKLLERGA